MSEKKELNQEQLEKVSGGMDEWGEKMSKYLPSSHGDHIGKDYAKYYIGQDFYVVNDSDREEYYWGTLTDHKNGNHYIYVVGHNNYWACKQDTHYTGCFQGSSYTLFLYS